MDTKEYIASGILESYAMGVASDQEVREVECLTAIYPELKSELENIQLKVEEYVQSLAVAAPSASKENILSAIKTIKQDSPLTKVETDNKLKVAPIKAGKVFALQPYLKFATAASILVIVGLGLLFKQLQTKYSNLEVEVTAYKNNTNQQISEMRDSLKNVSDERSFLVDASTETVLLAGTKLSPNSVVKVFYNSEKKEYAIEYNKLPKAAKGKQYQLWAIVDGQPLDLGILSKELAYIKRKTITVGDVQAFAITLEQEGGSEVPTLEAMFVVGNV